MNFQRRTVFKTHFSYHHGKHQLITAVLQGGTATGLAWAAGLGEVAAEAGGGFVLASRTSAAVKASTHTPDRSPCRALRRHHSVLSAHLPFDSEMSVPALKVTEMLAYGHHDVCPPC